MSIIPYMTKRFHSGPRGTVSESDLNFFHSTDDPDEAVEIIREHREKQTGVRS